MLVFNNSVITENDFQVTRSGNMTTNMNHPHKKPYEILLLAAAQDDFISVCQRNIPHDHIIISIPCSLHSKKPPIAGRDILLLFLIS